MKKQRQESNTREQGSRSVTLRGNPRYDAEIDGFDGKLAQRFERDEQVHAGSMTFAMSRVRPRYQSLRIP